MRVLLDTHVLIWLVEGDKNLSTVARSAITYGTLRERG
jgi:PIN domain nuclease of toxin-antitoxin system